MVTCALYYPLSRASVVAVLATRGGVVSRAAAVAAALCGQDLPRAAALLHQ
jgi:hypothetical protein